MHDIPTIRRASIPAPANRELRPAPIGGPRSAAPARREVDQAAPIGTGEGPRSSAVPLSRAGSHNANDNASELQRGGGHQPRRRGVDIYVAPLYKWDHNLECLLFIKVVNG